MALTGYAENTPVRANLTGVIGDFETVISRLSKVAYRLDGIGDRIEGSRPQATDAVEKDPAPHSTISDLQRKRDNLLSLCDRLETEANRIDRALGGGDDKLVPGRIA